MHRAEDRRAPPPRARSAEQEGARAHRRSPRRDAEGDGAERRHLPLGRVADGGRRASCAGCRSATPTSRSRITAGRSTPSASPRWSWRSCSTSPRRSSHAALAPRRIARRAPAHRFPARDDERFLAHSLMYRNADGSCRVEYLPVTITRWPPAERVYGEAAPHGGSHHAAGRAVPSGAGV